MRHDDDECFEFLTEDEQPNEFQVHWRQNLHSVSNADIK